MSTSTSSSSRKQKFKVQCEYCGCFVEESNIYRYIVHTYTKPIRHTAAGTQFYTNGKEHTERILDLCPDCHNTASTSTFREITGAKEGVLQYRLLDKKHLKAVNS